MTSGGSRQNVDRVLNQKNLAKNESFVHFRSNLEILTGFQRPGLDPPVTDDDLSQLRKMRFVVHATRRNLHRKPVHR